MASNMGTLFKCKLPAYVYESMFSVDFVTNHFILNILGMCSHECCLFI